MCSFPYCTQKPKNKRLNVREHLLSGFFLRSLRGGVRSNKVMNILLRQGKTAYEPSDIVKCPLTNHKFSERIVNIALRIFQSILFGI